MNYLVSSRTILKIPYLSVFLNSSSVAYYVKKDFVHPTYLSGWGLKPTTLQLRHTALKYSLPFCTLEDGYFRSFLPGQSYPLLSLAVDNVGIYYNCYNSSDIEFLLRDKLEFEIPSLKNLQKQNIAKAKLFVSQHGLSKYNHAPDFNPHFFQQYDWQQRKKVLVIDQTAGDMSIIYGGADAGSFQRMLAAARAEHPDAVIVVKTHPEVSGGRKKGYLSDVVADERTCVLRDSVNPIQLLQAVDEVYVVTSTMGFEALLVGKPVTTFGVPWYAGWGVTDDRVTFEQAQDIWKRTEPTLSKTQRKINRLLPPQSDWTLRRTKKRTVDELFAAAYMQYARYLNPVTKERGTIFDVMDWLVLQKSMAKRFSGRMVAVGFRRWKAANIRPMLSLFPNKVHFVPTALAAETLSLTREDCLIHWGKKIPAGLAELAQSTGARLLCMEDGFIRSVGLGSDLIRPHSLVLDESGIYFDPTKPSDLEHLLNDRVFTDDDLQRARKVCDFIVEHNITKYNIDVCQSPKWLAQAQGKQVILVPGQVEDDASIVYGCTDVKTNLALLKAARAAHPDGFVVYKVHPDVLAKNRKGKVNWAELKQYADVIETETSVVSCINACDVVHTMTSLTGFDALLRGKQVVVYGRPFYAGWGLTQDRGAAFEPDRRKRILSLDELVAGALLHYPIYYDWELKGYTTCEATLHTLLKERERLSESGGLGRLRVGFVRRQWRKAMILAKAFWSER